MPVGQLITRSVKPTYTNSRTLFLMRASDASCNARGHYEATALECFNENGGGCGMVSINERRDNNELN